VIIIFSRRTLIHRVCQSVSQSVSHVTIRTNPVSAELECSQPLIIDSSIEFDPDPVYLPAVLISMSLRSFSILPCISFSVFQSYAFQMVSPQIFCIYIVCPHPSFTGNYYIVPRATHLPIYTLKVSGDLYKAPSFHKTSCITKIDKPLQWYAVISTPHTHPPTHIELLTPTSQWSWLPRQRETATY
jgi:hypothetical protein